VFFIYGVSVQILITAALLLGGSAALNVTTGASTVAMNYLIPFGVVIYTYLGGLKSTFLSDYVHTVVIFVILLITMFKVMASSSVPILGSPGKLWELLQPAAISSPAVGAKDGSYLTVDSGEGLLLAGVILVSGFGSVFVDPSYGQKAIAGEASAVVKGYFYGGMLSSKSEG
jgi:Na+/proline symporter